MVKSNGRQRGSVTLINGDDVDTVVLPHPDGEVGGTGIDSGSKTISLSNHGKQSRDGCGALLSGCRAWKWS